MKKELNAPGREISRSSPVSVLKGIGPKSAETFGRAGIFSIADLQMYYPRRYDCFLPPVSVPDLQEGTVAAICARCGSRLSARYVKGMHITAGTVSDGLGECGVTWFHMPYMATLVKPGVLYVFRGLVKRKGKRLTLEHPAVFTPENYRELISVLQPVYPLVKGLTNKAVQNAVRQSLSLQDASEEYLPEEIRKRYHLCDYGRALQQIHFPAGMDELAEARRRLVFDEFFLFLLTLRTLKERRDKTETSCRMAGRDAAERILQSLPYQLTGAQNKVWNTISRELDGTGVMARLIQGDVGSGKTIVSFLAMATAAENGFQAALMAPTEVLAGQHFMALNRTLESAGLPYEAVLLTGSLSAKEKRTACEKLKSGQAFLAVGTHALIQENVEFANLGLVITDEQHRFGVRQRETLSGKGLHPHTIVMSATPIPRTLAVILYGDLDISVIDELPANRLPVKNAVVGTEYREKAWRFITGQLEAGHQAYIICPMVDENEEIEAEDVLHYTETVREALPGNWRVEYLHGKMRPAEKNAVMQEFADGKIQVLVSTTVVEVGVNVPNATVMMVENSERFGLAQLHQLRGRVGRGDAQSYCIFIHSSQQKEMSQRLEILGKTNDGFEIASKDLELRGPGDLFGLRQSGIMGFTLADIYADAGILQLADEAAGDLLARDPGLEQPEHLPLKVYAAQLQERQSASISL